MNKIIKNVRCDNCRNRFPIEVVYTDYMAWRNGAVIQNAMPYLTADEQELLISATCGTCWDEMFGVFA